jgi:hypothetical protein
MAFFDECNTHLVQNKACYLKGEGWRGAASICAASIIVLYADAKSLRQQRRAVEQRLRALRPARQGRQNEIGIDCRVDQAPGALHVGPVREVVTGEDPPPRCHESRRRCGGDPGEARGRHAADLRAGETGAERHLAASFQRSRAAPLVASKAEIDTVKIG